MGGIEHRRELEVGSELAIHRGDRRAERALPRRVAATKHAVEERHRADARIAARTHHRWLFDTSHVYSGLVPTPSARVAAPPPHFPVGGPVPAADLVGRETYIRRIAERLSDGNHVLVAGPRRIGKTSLILEVLRRLRRRGALTAYVDCLGATDVRGLGERLVDALLENLSGVERSFEQAKAIAAGMRPTVKVRYEHVELALDLAREKNAQRFFEGALDLPRALAART